MTAKVRSQHQMFQKLFEPGQIGSLKLKNRIVMPPMVTNLAGRMGEITESMKSYYESRAAGGTGLIITEGGYIGHPFGKVSAHMWGLHNEECLSELSELAAGIHKHGATCALQIHHAGPKYHAQINGFQPVAASAIPVPVQGYEMPRELSIMEIEEYVLQYGKAAEITKRAGFDGVEIHAGHSYLMCGFLSPYFNRRTDKYGGDFRGRTRFFLEVIKAVREAVEAEYPVWCRISADEGMAGGIHIDEAKKVAQLAEEAGLNAISVTGSLPGRFRSIASMYDEDGWLLPSAEEVKKAISIPVMGTGKITPEIGEEALRTGKVDFVCFGRPLIADPDLPNKLRDGKLEDIRPCCYCGSCVAATIENGQEIRCSVNSRAGKEYVYEARSASKRKKVFVIGGGPAGMEAARVAALRGHDVTLFERNRRLGGQMKLAALPPGKTRLKKSIDYFASQVNRMCHVELSKEAEADMIIKARPDVVIVATGVNKYMPEISREGSATAAVIHFTEVLTEEKEVGPKAVIIGGGLVGCEIAHFLADKGKEVTILEMMAEIGLGIGTVMKVPLLERLSRLGVKAITNATYRKLTPLGLEIMNKEGEAKIIPVDSVIFAVGSKPNTELFKAVRDKVAETYLIGDSFTPRRILDAIAEGAYVARMI